MHLVQQVKILDHQMAKHTSDPHDVGDCHAKARHVDEALNDHLEFGHLVVERSFFIIAVNYRVDDKLCNGDADGANEGALTSFTDAYSVGRNVGCYDDQMAEVAIIKRDKALSQQGQVLVVDDQVGKLAPPPRNNVDYDAKYKLRQNQELNGRFNGIDDIMLQV